MAEKQGWGEVLRRSAPSVDQRLITSLRLTTILPVWMRTR
jgi:hypothetical protein